MLSTYNIKPIPELQPYVNTIWIVDGGGLKRPHIEKMIPFGCSDFVFIEKPTIYYHSEDTKREPLNSFFVSGQITKPYYLEYQPGCKSIGFGFFPHTGHLFTRFSASQFTNGLVALEDMGFEKKCNILAPQLEEASTFPKKLVLLQRFVLQQIQENRQLSIKQEYVRIAVEQALGSKGNFNLKKVCNQLNVSERFLQLSFKDYVGVSPTLFSKVVRFLNAVSLLQKENHSLTEKGLILGYYDQSHFIRDFKRFSGLSPKQYFQESHYLLDEFTSEESHSFLYNSMH
ncbi:MAG: helix-turn-helix transcriptional regulator [Bacteroidota bacterium]